MATTIETLQIPSQVTLGDLARRLETLEALKSSAYDAQHFEEFPQFPRQILLTLLSTIVLAAIVGGLYLSTGIEVPAMVLLLSVVLVTILIDKVGNWKSRKKLERSLAQYVALDADALARLQNEAGKSGHLSATAVLYWISHEARVLHSAIRTARTY